MIIYSALPGNPPLLHVFEHFYVDLRNGLKYRKQPKPYTEDMREMVDRLKV